MAIQLDEATQETITTMLKEFNLQEYMPLVEDLILGRLLGVDILRMIRVFCQTSYLKGRLEAIKDQNTALKIAANMEDYWRHQASGAEPV